MRFLIRALLFLLLIGGLVVGVAYFAVGSIVSAPIIELKAPEKFVGRTSSVEFFAAAPAAPIAALGPGGQFSRLEAALEQGGQSTQVFSLEPTAGSTAGDVKQASADRLYIIRPIGPKTVPSLKEGPARLTITASRPVLYGLRDLTTTVTRDLQVRLQPPQAGVISLHHFVNHGGAEFVVFRATPPDVSSGVRVGEVTFSSFPGSSVGIADPAVRVAFFALGHDQDRNAPIVVFARDEAGNEVTGNVERRIFPKPFAKSTIPIDDAFLQRVVPAIAQNSAEENIQTTDLLQAFLKINGDLRRKNNQSIAALAAKTRPEMMWREAFSQLGNTAVESRFADYRTYMHAGKEIDKQVHLGFDLASLQHAPVPASNRGVVLFANYLGIYGNVVIVDHGLGVQTLYAHLSTMEVKEGDKVEKGHVLGRTGSTGLAGGDHLHFTILVNGVAVNPVEWWDQHWMEDRVFRKIREAGGTVPSSASPTTPAAPAPKKQ
jgi:murein DD-endopeptidase MepM/ murein hydrolase activator NlpD